MAKRGPGRIAVKTWIVCAATGTLLASLYACSDDEETTTGSTSRTSTTQQTTTTTSATSQGGSGAQGGSGEGGGTGGNAACMTCSQYNTDCAPGSGMMMTGCEETNLCAASLALWTAYKTCLCTECATQCENYCTGSGMNNMCGGCVGNASGDACMAVFDACDADM